jgi:nitroimidazol reductase NimA-like FMN-containing flavoprotein (pyridoxamine 5'-phosphate oxidase superfamily)
MRETLPDEFDARTHVDDLSVEQCWHFLHMSDVGRLAVRTGDDIDVFPVNYLVDKQLLYFRSAPGSKLVDVTRSPNVTFQTDGTGDYYVWSVVVKGRAERVSYDAEIDDSGIARLRSLSPTDKWNFVRITPGTVTGRRFIPTR